MFKRHLLFFFASSLLLPCAAWAGPNEDLARGMLEGQSALVKQALLHGANPGQLVKLKGVTWTPLAWAAYWGNLDLVRWLLAKGALADPKHGQEALGYALSGGHMDVVRCLIESGVAFDSKDPDWEDTLVGLAASGHLEAVRFLLDKGVKPNRKDGGFSALMWASQDQFLHVAKLLLDRGADPNAKSQDGITALMCTINGADSEPPQDIIKLLLTKGADPDSPINTYERPSILMWAAQAGHLDLVKFLLVKGANPNGQDSNGQTVLMSAASGGKAEIVKLLLQKGADPRPKTKEGQTALGFAANPEVELLLLANGVSPQRIASDQSVLLDAADDGRLDEMKALLAKGVDPNTRDDAGRTALTRAALGREGLSVWVTSGSDYKAIPPSLSASRYIDRDPNLAVMKLLLEKGANPNARDAAGLPILVWSAYQNHSDEVTLLLAHGADPNLRDQYGNTALVLAALYNQADEVKLLLAKGADPKLKTRDGKTALDYAREAKAADVIPLLASLK